MSDIAIRVAELGKQYHIGKKQERYMALRDVLADAFVAPFRRAGKLLRGQATGAAELDEIIWALKEVSFEIKQGEVVGIIGRNGAGKSTLLKILSRITEPTEGYAEVHGRVGSLLEVGTGFHPELTGRENIFLNGAILGMQKAEIERKFDEIVDFAEIEKFLDTPVKHYSSGMHVRLAFAVAAHLEPEVLLVDEVLAVGDIKFQKKCLGKMGDVVKRGRTVLFVSHNMGAISQLCSTSLLVEHGKLVCSGPSRDVIREYLECLNESAPTELDNIAGRRGDGRLRFKAAYLCDGSGYRTSSAIAGEPLEIVLEYSVTEPLANAQFMLTIYNYLGMPLAHCHVDASGERVPVQQGRGQVRCRIPRFPFSPGQYRIAIGAEDDRGTLDWLSTACAFDVDSSSFYRSAYLPPVEFSPVLLDHSWRIVPDGVGK